MSGTGIVTRVEAGIGWLILDRPREMNSFDGATAAAIIAAVAGFAADAAVRVMVVSGNGPAFSAGGDFNWVMSWPGLSERERYEGARAMTDAVQAIHDFPKPSIARVHGAAVGGGVGVMLACDWAIAADGVKIGMTSARNGLLAGIAIKVLIDAAGPRVARQLLLHGGTIDTAEAARLGLVDRVVPASGLDEAIGALAGELIRSAPSVQSLVKRLVDELGALPPDSAAARVALEVARQCMTDEAREGMGAFLDKRKPAWSR